MRRFSKLCLGLMLVAVGGLRAQPAAATIEWDTVAIAAMKTSISRRRSMDYSRDGNRVLQ